MNDYSEYLASLGIRLNYKFPEYIFGTAVTPRDTLRIYMVSRAGGSLQKEVEVEYKDILDTLFIISDLMVYNELDVYVEIIEDMYNRIITALGL